jgi:hypothetical protein
MDRKEFLLASLKAGIGCGALSASGECRCDASLQQSQEVPSQKDLEFMAIWLTDLLDTIEAETDEATRARLMEGCGRGCFRRHQFKKDIAEKGKGDIDKLIEAYRANFNVWREGDDLHIQYGTTSPRCYCPVVRNRPAKPNDIHCNCTRATHKAIIEGALQRPVKLEIVETLRRGGKSCHFVAHLT